MSILIHEEGAAPANPPAKRYIIAWCFWRTVYLMKLPRLPKKLRVMVGWTLDLFFARDIEQMITLRDVEALSDMARRIRTRRTQLTPNAASSPSEAGIRDQLK